jgi:hypothetical protein
VPDWDPLSSVESAGDVTGEFVRRFEELAGRLSKVGYQLPVMCFLDEMERVLPLPTDIVTKVDEFNVCFGTLRALSQERRQLALLVADVHPDCNRVNRWSQQGVGTNPLYAFFKEVHLAPFSCDETSGMLESIAQLMGWSFDEPTLKHIHVQSGGHPFLSRQLASLLGARLNPHQGQAIQWPDAQRIINRAVQESGTIKDYFGQNIWADLEARSATTAQALVRTLANAGRAGLTEIEIGALLADQARPGSILGALQWLESVGLVHREDDGKMDAYRMSVPLFARWLQLQFGSVTSAAGGPA